MTLKVLIYDKFFKYLWKGVLCTSESVFFMCFSWVPVYTDKDQRLAVMSIGFLLNSRDDAVVWRGPKKNGIYIDSVLYVFCVLFFCFCPALAKKSFI